MNDPIDAFVLSLDRDEPSPSAAPILFAVWHGLRGDWDTAHELARTRDERRNPPSVIDCSPRGRR